MRAIILMKGRDPSEGWLRISREEANGFVGMFHPAVCGDDLYPTMLWGIRLIIDGDFNEIVH